MDTKLLAGWLAAFRVSLPVLERQRLGRLVVLHATTAATTPTDHLRQFCLPK